MEKLLNPPEKKKLPLLIATTLTFIIVFIAVSWFLTMVFDKFYFALFT
jgi:poly-D-alanine transfer protein DltD